MLLTSKDLNGSIMDKPEFQVGYSENRDHFEQEFSSLMNLAPGKAGWMNALSFFNVYKGPDGYRIALPIKWLPVEVKGYAIFENHLLSATVFPNRFQAAQVAARIVMRSSGY